jgi:hypothetical protein
LFTSSFMNFKEQAAACVTFLILSLVTIFFCWSKFSFDKCSRIFEIPFQFMIVLLLNNNVNKQARKFSYWNEIKINLMKEKYQQVCICTKLFLCHSLDSIGILRRVRQGQVVFVKQVWDELP